MIVMVVTPCVGVWIETDNKLFSGMGDKVTPCVGVWIETWNILIQMLM